MRGVLVVACLVAGVGLAAVGFLAAAGVPPVEFAPAIFIAGVCLVFLSAVVYEFVPDR